MPIVIVSAPVRTSEGSIALGSFLPGRGRESSDEAEDAIMPWLPCSGPVGDHIGKSAL